MLTDEDPDSFLCHRGDVPRPIEETEDEDEEGDVVAEVDLLPRG